jgi:hypothetical protein
MKRRTISLLGSLMALLGISRGAAADLRVSLRLADTAQFSAKHNQAMLRGDSRIIQTRLDGLYDEPGFRPLCDRAKVETTDNRITVSISDTSGAARVEYLASTLGRITFRLIAGDSVEAAMLARVDDWLGSHPWAAAASPDSLHHWISYRRYRYRVLERDYPLVSNALRAVDTAVFGGWLPAFGLLDTGKTDTSRTLFFVERQAEISNARGGLIAYAVARRFRGSRPLNALQTANEAEPFIVDIQLTHDTLVGYDPVQKLAELTTSHIHQGLAIMLDTVVLSAPVIQSSIPDGSCMVTTGDTLGAFARDLTTIFLSGPLYAPLVVERVERIGGR